MPVWLQILLALMAFFGVSGSIAPFMASRYRKGSHAELVEKLREKFPTKHELNNFRQSLEGMVADCCDEARLAQEGAKLALGNADMALGNLAKVEAEQKLFGHRFHEEVLVPLRSMAEEQKKVGENLAAQTALLRRLMDEMDRRS